MMKAKNRKDWLFPLVNGILLLVLVFFTLYPVINTVAYSFNDGTDAVRGNIGLWPRKFSLESYKTIMSDKAVYRAAWISASKTVLITLLNLFWTSMLAYALSRKEFVLRKLLRYDPNTAGGVMTPEVVTLRETWSISEALERIRKTPKKVENLYNLYVVDEDNRLLGLTTLRNLVFLHKSFTMT